MEGAFAFDTEHKLFTQELAKYVHNGCVDYSSWKKDPKPLNIYLQSLAELSAQDYASLAEQDKKALWLNGYNAFTIKVVLEHYPIAGTISYYPSNSLRQIPDVWEAFHFELAGRNVDLDDLEHNIIRRELHDPRLHFAVVCAARGAAPLPDHAYLGKGLDEVLESAKNAYLSDSKNVHFDAEHHILNVSRVFNWFPLDFAPSDFFKGRKIPPTDDQIIVAYLSQNGPPKLKAELAAQADLSTIKIKYIDYDWSLNECH